MMSYSRWGEGDPYAYQGSGGYVVHVAAGCVREGVRARYVKPTAHALVARILWLGSKGCDYPWDTLRYLKEDIIAEVEAQETAAREAV
jgi:hypothetical protein